MYVDFRWTLALAILDNSFLKFNRGIIFEILTAEFSNTLYIDIKVVSGIFNMIKYSQIVP